MRFILAIMIIISYFMLVQLNLAKQFNYSPSERKLLLKNKNLMDVQSCNKSILVDLKYSSKDNFLGQDVYDDVEHCFLQKEAALKLCQAQRYLSKIKPGYRLKVFDGLRPLSCQKKMWEMVKGTKKQKYVANPKRGSIHNFGAAVDLTIVNDQNIELDMGTPFDYFGPLAEPRYKKKMLALGKLTIKHINNRKLLRTVMMNNGFIPVHVEWWHFNAFSRKIVQKKFKIIQ